MSYPYRHLIPILLFGLVCFLHIYSIEDVPDGLYIDEVSVGLNAATIAESGVDEFGEPFPTYFRAFGEWKNPIYIYATALSFKFLGVSEFSLRLPSALFFIVALIFTVLLIRSIFPKNRMLVCYTIIGFGLLPAYLVVSRIAFELIAQLTWISAVAFLVWCLFHKNSSFWKKMALSAVLGLVLGTSIYTYSTARLLSFLMTASILIVYFSRENIVYLATISIAALLSVIPYLSFAIGNEGALTTRFYLISYVDDDIGLLKKIGFFVKNYFSYFVHNYLVIQGDGNHRHMAGYGGALYATVFVGFVLGMAVLFKGRKKDSWRFFWFVFVNLMCSPIAASLTSDSQHSLRAFLLPYYMFLFSCLGASVFFRYVRGEGFYCSAVVIVFIVLLYEVTFTQSYFYTRYKHDSAHAMEGSGYFEVFNKVIERSPNKVFLLGNRDSATVTKRFYQYLIEGLDELDIRTTRSARFQKGACYIYSWWSENDFSRFPEQSSYYYIPKTQVNFLQKFIGIREKDTVVRMRCYKE